MRGWNRYCYVWSVHGTAVACLLSLLVMAQLAGAAGQSKTAPTEAGSSAGQSVDDLLKMDIEQLSRQEVVVPSLDVEVTSVSRQESTIGRSPAAVFVITQEMIRRSTANNIPDLLRMVPGMEVAQIDANSWAITCRGFNSMYANKLLVQIDGRSVYTPLFAGVLWYMQDVPLEDVERIEVIRGPGATVWGANAVNGVINIITNNAGDTQGPLLRVGGGYPTDRDFATLQYGGRVGRGLKYRVYGKYFNDGPCYFPLEEFDQWRVGQTGFRTDWDCDPWGIDKITFQGDYFDGHIGSRTTFPSPMFPFVATASTMNPIRGGNLLTRWSHTFSEDSDMALQFYFDRAKTFNTLAPFAINTYDIDFQHHFPLTVRQGIVWGLGFRSVRSHTVPTFLLTLDPADRTTDLYSAFIQDEIELVEDRLLFTIGCKGEHNAFTGYEFQPSARVVFLPSKRASAWGAISRAVRTPALVESNSGFVRYFPLIPGTPTWPVLWCNPNLESEELIAYELGYRAQPTDAFSWDLALFYNVYDRLSASDWLPFPLFPPQFILANDMYGDTYGVELSWKWEATPRWHLEGYYSFLQMQLHSGQAAQALSPEVAEGYSPHNQVRLQSGWDLSDNLEFDVAVRYVDNLPTLDVPNYISLDARLGWRLRKHLELAVVGQNLLDSHHLEFVDSSGWVQNSEARRGVYAKLTWQY
jgi:iron complex outermembrane receptor protein